MLLADPELRGVSCVIFDEFHERSLASDLGLTLVCDIQKALREDLLLLLMSATIDWEDLQSKLHDFQLLTFDAQGYPVDVHWLEPPKRHNPWLFGLFALCGTGNRSGHKNTAGNYPCIFAGGL